MTADALTAVRDVVADIMAVAPEAITAEMTPDDLDGWDSLSMLNMILDLQDRLDIAFEPADVEGMTSVGAVAAVVEAKLAAR